MKRLMCSPRVSEVIIIDDSDDDFEDSCFDKKPAKRRKLELSPISSSKMPTLLNSDAQPLKDNMVNGSKSEKANGLLVNNHKPIAHTRNTDSTAHTPLCSPQDLLTGLELDRLALVESGPSIGTPYDNFQQQTLSDVLSHNHVTSGLCLNDFLNILESGVSRRCYIPGPQLLPIIKCCYDWQVDNASASVFALLFKDLSLRPVRYSDLVEIFTFCMDQFHPVLAPGLCNPTSLIPIHLTLEYLEKALIACQNNFKEIAAKFYKAIGNQGISQLATLVIQVLSHAHNFSLPGVGGGSLGTIILARLQLLACLCLSTCESEIEREELSCSIAVSLSSRLGQLKSLEDRKTIIDSLPSDLVREKLLDIYLDKEFMLHSAATQSKKTEQFSTCDSSLAKFCCVHLYRTPYLHTGELCDPSYFLYLLTSLLHSILSLKKGGPFLSSPQLECSSQKEPPSAEKSLQMQETLKSHISYLVDRLSEDEVTLSHLDDHRCWSYLMLLGNIPDVLATQ